MDQPERAQLQVWLGVGIPSLTGGIVAILLGIPWFIVCGFLAFIGIGLIFNT